MTYVGKSPADIIATAVDTTTGTFSGDLTVDTNTLYVDSANNRVGVGTVSPAEKVDIAGNDANAVSLQIVNSETASASVLLGQAGSSGYGVTSWGSSVGILDGTNGLAIGSADPSAPLLFYTSNTRTERARIDSSGNLFVGNTAEFVDGTGTGDTGIQINPIGLTISTRNGGIAGIFGRQSSDGDILQFRKSGSTVGSIGTDGTNIYIGSGTKGIKLDATRLMPRTNTDGNGDNTIDIGGALHRWKDLYLSGGVYLGGTGSANKLDDYEEGEYDATVTASTSGSITLHTGFNSASYTKVGNLVHVSGLLNVASVSSPVGYTAISLPFTVANLPERRADSNAVLYITGVVSANMADFVGTINENTSVIIIQMGDNINPQNDSAEQIRANCNIVFSATYRTA